MSILYLVTTSFDISHAIPAIFYNSPILLSGVMKVYGYPCRIRTIKTIGQREKKDVQIEQKGGS